MNGRHGFTEAVKRDAVRLAEERGSTSEVARDLGIHESQLSRWKRERKEQPSHLLVMATPVTRRWLGLNAKTPASRRRMKY